MVDAYILVMAGFGALVLLTAWLPMVLKEAPLSLPIVCVAIGTALFAWLAARSATCRIRTSTCPSSSASPSLWW